MAWDEVDVQKAITAGLLRFYTAIGRAINEKSISMRSEYLIKYFDGYSAKKITLFFEWVSDTFDKFLPDREFRRLAIEKRNHSFSQDTTESFFYGVTGALVRHGTFYTIATATTAEWHLLPPREKELSIKANHDLLVGPEMHEWIQICDKRYKVRPGKVQKPPEEWTPQDYEIYNQYLDWYDKDLELWNKYEKDLKGE